MFRDGREIESGSEFRFDICILGAGAAGITLARALAGSNTSIALIESGGFEFAEATQALYEGSSRGTFMVPGSPYLTQSRLRYFGGTTNHWTGWCRPLDAIDFEARPWLPHSGWPLTRQQLDPFYRRASEILEIRPFDETPSATGAERGNDLLPSQEHFQTRYFHLSPPTRFKDRYRDELDAAPGLEVFLHSNACRLAATADGQAIEYADLATLSGRRFRLRANTFIVALGGIENARLLLLSDDVVAAGIGNQHDVVGRYFMDQPHLEVAQTTLPRVPKEIQRYVPFNHPQLGHRVFGFLCPSEATLRQHQLLNFSLELRMISDENLPPATEGLAQSTRALEDRPLEDRALEDRALGTKAEAPSPVGVSFYARTEATPNPDSRVKLSDQLDALGLRKTHLAWHVLRSDRDLIHRGIELLAQALGCAGSTRVWIPFNPKRPWRGSWGGYHHLGATRMHQDPKLGVTDGDCKVHGVDNLYIAGSSLFPTYGYANPTMTLVALALRLADHLEARS